MLVPLKIVENWYQRGSWVYRNFAYIYQNPLWNCNIPTGASVCRYFWQSLIVGLFIMRPLVSILAYLVLPVCRKVGMGIAPLDRWLARQFFKLFHGKAPKDEQLDAAFRGAAVCLFAVIVALSWLGGHFIVKPLIHLCHDVNIYGTDNTVIRWVVYQIPPLFVIIAGTSLYTLWNRFNGNLKTCKMRAYLMLFLVYSVTTLLYMLGGEIWHNFVHVCSAVWDFICNLCSVCAHGIWVGITTLAGWIWTAVCWCAHWIWRVLLGIWFLATFSAGPGPVPLWVYVFLGIYILYKLGLYFSEAGLRAADRAFDALSASDQRALSRELWCGALFRLACGTDTSEELIRALAPPTAHKKELHVIDRFFAQRIGREIIDNVCFRLLDMLERYQPHFPGKYWENKLSYDELRGLLYAEVEQHGLSRAVVPTFDNATLRAAVTAIWSKHHSEIVRRVKDVEKAEAEAQKRREIRQNSFMHKACERFTDGVCNAGIGFGKLFVTFCIIIGMAIRAFVNFVVSAICWFFRNLGIFFAYLWVFLVARKKKACPYMQFRD